MNNHRGDVFRDKASDLARRITGTGSVTEQLLRWIGAVTIMGILAGALLFFVLYFLIDLPDPNRDFESQRTDVYYSDGKHKIGSFAVQEREAFRWAMCPSRCRRRHRSRGSGRDGGPCGDRSSAAMTAACIGSDTSPSGTLSRSCTANEPILCLPSE